MEQIVKSAQRKLASFERELSRMESDPTRIRSTQFGRLIERIAEVEKKLIPGDNAIEGYAQVSQVLDQFKTRIETLKHQMNTPARKTPPQSPITLASSSRDKGANSAPLSSSQPSPSQPSPSQPSPSQQRKISSQVSKVERAIASLSRSVETFLAEPTVTAERLQNIAIAKLEDSREKLADIIQIAPDAAASLKDQLEAFAIKINARTDEHADTNAEKQIAKDRIDVMHASGEYSAKQFEIQALQGQATKLANLKMKSYAFLEATDPPAVIDQVISWPKVSKDFLTYARDTIDALSITPKANSLVLLAGVLEKEIIAANQNLKALEKNMQNVFEAHLHSVLEFAQESEKEGRFHVFGSPSNQDSIRSIEADMLWADAWLKFYGALPNSSDAKLAHLKSIVQENISQVDAIQENLRDKIVASNSLGPNTYSGADHDALISLAEAGWRTVHANAPISEIRILAQQWTRFTGEHYSKTHHQFEKYDYSTLDAYVIEQPIGNISTFWRVELQKRHMEQDALISNPASRTRHDPKPKQQILTENLQKNSATIDINPIPCLPVAMATDQHQCPADQN